jgi:hypothetical protein
LTLTEGFFSDLKASQLPPRWPPVLPKGTFADPAWELVAIDATSISFVVNRVLKVRRRLKLTSGALIE